MADTEDLEINWRLVPGAAADAIIKNIDRQLVGYSIGFDHNRPRVPLTLRQKVRIWRVTARWWLHDRMFPDCDA